MAAIACVTPSPHRIVHNDSIQIYEETPAPVRHRHSLANWTSVTLGNDPNNHTVDESTMGQQDFNLIIDPVDQQDREINNNQGTDPEIMYSNYSTNHLEDLDDDITSIIFYTTIDVCSITDNNILYSFSMKNLDV